MYVTATEFKANFGKYMELAQTQDIRVTKRGKEIARVVASEMDIASHIRAMRGAITLNDETKDITVADIRAERRARYERAD